MRRFAGWMTGGLILWTLVMVFGLLTSDGEPVCSGMLITSVDDSDPPGCPSVWQGMFEVGAALLGLALAASCVGFAVASWVAKRRI